MNKNIFKRGDIVECINNNNVPELKIGKHYIVKRSNDSFIYLGEGDCCGFTHIRFKLVHPEPYNGLIVENITGSLHKIVQEIFFSFGYGWPNCGGNSNSYFNPGAHYKKYIFYFCDQKESEKSTMYLTTVDNKDNFITLDATKDLNKLMEHLQNYKDGKYDSKTPPEINGYKAEYKEGDATIKFGCAMIDISMLRGINDVLKKSICGNGSVKSIKLDSGVELNEKNVLDILSYVDSVNGVK